MTANRRIRTEEWRRVHEVTRREREREREREVGERKQKERKKERTSERRKKLERSNAAGKAGGGGEEVGCGTWSIGG